MGQKSMEKRGKSTFFRSAFWEISSVFSLIYLVFFPKKYSKCDTCDSKKVKTPVSVRAYVRARGKIIGLFTIQFPRFSICTFPCRSFPLHCVLKNEPLLLSKRHVVSLKTTRCFSQNKPSFFLKQAVVLFLLTPLFS